MKEIIVSIVISGALAAGTPEMLSDIESSVASFRGREIVMTLKLRNYDRVFEKCIFYDRKNRDIEFDVPLKKITEELKADMLNFHEGMNYEVTFRVTGVGDLGMVTGTLTRAVPVLLKKLP